MQIPEIDRVEGSAFQVLPDSLKESSSVYFWPVMGCMLDGTILAVETDMNGEPVYRVSVALLRKHSIYDSRFSPPIAECLPNYWMAL